MFYRLFLRDNKIFEKIVKLVFFNVKYMFFQGMMAASDKLI